MKANLNTYLKMLVVLRRQVLTGTPLCGLTWLSRM